MSPIQFFAMFKKISHLLSIIRHSLHFFFRPGGMIHKPQQQIKSAEGKLKLICAAKILFHDGAHWSRDACREPRGALVSGGDCAAVFAHGHVGMPADSCVHHNIIKIFN